MDPENISQTQSTQWPAHGHPAVQKAQAQGGAQQQAEVQAAKDFESLIIGQLLKDMQSTIGEWGFEQDGASKQMHGLFWMQLSQEIANQGGVGLWQDVLQSVKPGDNPSAMSTVDTLL